LSSCLRTAADDLDQCIELCSRPKIDIYGEILTLSNHQRDDFETTISSQSSDITPNNSLRYLLETDTRSNHQRDDFETIILSLSAEIISNHIPGYLLDTPTIRNQQSHVFETIQDSSPSQSTETTPDHIPIYILETPTRSNQLRDVFETSIQDSNLSRSTETTLNHSPGYLIETPTRNYAQILPNRNLTASARPPIFTILKIKKRKLQRDIFHKRIKIKYFKWLMRTISKLGNFDIECGIFKQSYITKVDIRSMKDLLSKLLIDIFIEEVVPDEEDSEHCFVKIM
jgi:hypothetical protein